MGNDEITDTCDIMPTSSGGQSNIARTRNISNQLATVSQVSAAEIQKRREKAIRAAKSDNTRLAYRQAIAHYQDTNGKLPASPDDIADYLLRCQNVYAYATLEVRLSALAQWHQFMDHEDPTKDKSVLTILKGIREQVDTNQRKAPPIMAADLVSMVHEIRRRGSAGEKSGVLLAKRNEALLLTGYFGMLRVSELTALRPSDVEFSHEGVDLYIRHSKNDAIGKGISKAIPVAPADKDICPVVALRDWTDYVVSAEKPFIFSALTSEKPLSTHSVNKLLKSLSAVAVTLPKTVYFSSHSLRRGTASTATQLGVSKGVVKRQGGWATDKAVDSYIDEGKRFQRNPAHAIYSLL